MKKRYLTLFVIPDDHSRTRQIKIPLRLFKGMAALSVLMLLSLSFILYDYTSLRLRLSDFNRLKKESVEQKIQIRTFSSKVKNLEDRMTRLRFFDKKLRIIANLKPSNRSDEIFGVGGPLPEEGDTVFLTQRRDQLMKQMNSDIDQLDIEAANQEKSFVDLQEYLRKKSAKLASTPAIWPTRGWVTSSFGYRRSPFTGMKQMHKGIDIANRIGTPVIATGNGYVMRVRRGGGFGRYIMINHGHGIETRYGHLSRILVKVGQRVKRGQKIGLMGNSGRSTGPHLHYEVIAKGVLRNPFKYILN